MTSPPSASPLRSSLGRRHLPAILALAAVATAYLWGLGHPLLWSDEADTGIEARAILRQAYPSAFDGRNLSLFDNGSQLSQGFLSQKIPWVPYYVGAASLALFGDNTRGLRVLFALLGLASFFPLRTVLKPRLRHPDWAAALVLLAPQTVLFAREARYYAVLIFLYAVLLWLLTSEFRTWVRAAALSLVFVLIFHTQPFAAACAAGSLALHALIFRRDRIGMCLAAGLAGFLAWFAWYRALGAPLAPTATTLESIGSNFGGWIGVFCSGLFASVLDLDAVGCVPLLLGAILLGMSIRRRRELWNLLREPLIGFVALNLLVQSVAAAGLLGYETADRFAILRYMPHLLVFSLAALIAAFAGLIGAARAQVIAVIAVACNLGTASFWIQPRTQRVPFSWVPGVYGEILRASNGAVGEAVARLRQAPPPAGRLPVLYVSPAWTRDVALFYLGDRCLISPEFGRGAEAQATMRRVADLMGASAFRRAIGPPDWILSFGNFLAVPPGYSEVAAIPSFRSRPDGGTRPELTRHTFLQGEPVSAVKLYRPAP